MSKSIIIRLTLLCIFTVTLSGCTSLRARFQNQNATDATTPTGVTEETTETYSSVQKVREAQSDAEAVQTTSTEVDTALLEVENAESTGTLNTQDVGL